MVESYRFWIIGMRINIILAGISWGVGNRITPWLGLAVGLMCAHTAYKLSKGRSP